MFGKWAERVDAIEERPDAKEFYVHVVAENAAELTKDSVLMAANWKQGD